MANALKLESLRSLLRRGPLTDGIFHHNIWFRGHNNPRYAALLPRLSRVHHHLVVCSDRRIPRGLQFRFHRATRGLRNPLINRLARRRYRYAFITDIEQIPHAPGPLVVDIDDPRFSEREVRLLSHPSVRVFVVTSSAAGERFEQLGVTTPWEVVPQGVSFDQLDHARVAALRAARNPGTLTVGWVAAWLVSEGDRDGANPLYNVDHLFELWAEISRRLPAAELVLVGEPSERVRARAGQLARVRLIGRVSQPEALAHTASFDIGLYPRRVDHSPFAVKIAEYLGLGVPVVAYDLPITAVVARGGAGVLAATPDAFVEAAVALGGDEVRRAELARAARAAGAALSWAALAERYEHEILDRYLPLTR